MCGAGAKHAGLLLKEKAFGGDLLVKREPFGVPASSPTIPNDRVDQHALAKPAGLFIFFSPEGRTDPGLRADRK